MLSTLHLNKIAALSIMALSSLSTLASCQRLPLSAYSPLSPAPYQRKVSPRSYIADQLVVQFQAPLSEPALQQFAQQHRLRPLRTGATGAVLFQTQSAGSSLQELQSDQRVEYAHQNVRYRRQFTINDPRSAEQSGLAVIGMGKAWDLGLGDPNVKIAVIDSGVDLQHPDLQANLVEGYNALTKGQTPPQDDDSHGTHAAGIAAAVGDNKLGVSGACPRCKIMPVKALGANGEGGGFDVAMGLVWAVDHGASVINMSLGGDVPDATLERAVKYALSRGTVLVVAAGNGTPERPASDQPVYPAALPGVISVGSVDLDGQRSSFSHYGTWVSVMAPGRNILSTLPISSSTDGYGLMSGTSMAAPMVAGVVGLMRSRHPQLTPAQIKSRLEGTCIDLGKPGFDPDTANGMVDAYRAIL